MIDCRRWSPTMSIACRVTLVLGLGVSATRVDAQVFELQGGGSSLYQGYGGALNIWGDGYEGNVGIGYLDGLRFRVFLKQLIGHERCGWATMRFRCVSPPMSSAARTRSLRRAPDIGEDRESHCCTRSSARVPLRRLPRS